MKISIAHLPEEQEKAAGTLAALLHLHPGAKVRKSDRHPPFKHIYLTVKIPLKGQQSVAAQGKFGKEGTPTNGRSREKTP